MKNSKPPHYQALFITHDCSNYGAATSLAGLLKCCSNDLEVDIIYADQSFRHLVTPELLRTRFGGVPRNADCLLLPFDHNILGKREVKPRLRDRLRSLLAAWNCRWKAARLGRYDYCHLNSLALHELTWIHPRTIVHVREVYQGLDLPAVRRNLERAAGVIFIDAATAAPFQELNTCTTILHNPFDMTDVPEHQLPVELVEKWHLRDRTVFAVIGAVNAYNKGVDYVLDEYRCAGLGSGAVLLVVGSGDPEFIQSLKQRYEGEDIVFVGETPNVKAIYRELDCLLRGDILPAVSRTATEALYSGASVILPGAPEEHEIYQEFRSRCFFYPTREPGALCAQIKKLAGYKATDRNYLSNLVEYRQSYLEFVTRIHEK